MNESNSKLKSAHVSNRLGCFIFHFIYIDGDWKLLTCKLGNCDERVVFSKGRCLVIIL